MCEPPAVALGWVSLESLARILAGRASRACWNHARMASMCGIVGGFSVRPLDCLSDPARVDRAIDSLAHRGPDDRGCYFTQDRRAFLGQRRLSIIDLAGGHQPLIDSTDQVRLVYNGEIYNYRGLRQPLVAEGYPFRTHSDGEVILPLYQREPVDFVQRLSGMFAIALLDETADRLTLVRDRNGIKPLYWWTDGATLLLASEAKAILTLLTERPALSATGLRAYLRWKYIPDPLTIFDGIRRLRPAEVLRAEPRGDRLHIETDTYWRPDYGGERFTDEQEALEELDRRLRAAVLSHLESDVDVGTLLSGGVDSSLVTAMAAQQSGRRLKTFSVGFKEQGFDQLPFARILAERYGTEHHEEHVELDPVVTVERMVRQFDEPFADSSALACLWVCETAAREVKVVLTGDGGDESFAGYRRYEDLAAAAHQPAWRRRLAGLSAVIPSALFSPEAKFARRLQLDALDPVAQHEERQVMCSRWLISRLLTERYQAIDDVDLFGEHRACTGASWHEVDAAQYIDLRMYLPGDILTKVDRTSMACSLECRVPLLDHHVTEFSASLPIDLKVRGGVRKYLLKRLAERYVPHELLYRPKMGFRIPIRRWFKRDLLDRTAALLHEGVLVRREILDPAGLAWLFRVQRRAWMDFGSQLWGMLFLEHWARAFLG